MCVGHENGKISLWNIDNLIEPKLLKTADMYKVTVTSLDFVSNFNEQVVAADVSGYVSLFVFKNGLFSYNSDRYAI